MTDRTMEITMTRGAREPTHFHPELELCFVIDGSVEITVGKQRHLLRKEDVLLVNSSIAHSILASEDAILFQVRYACQLVSELLGTSDYLFQCNSVLDRTRPYGELRKVLRDAVFQYVQNDRQTECLKLSCLYQVLDCLIEHYQTTYTPNLNEMLSENEKIQHIIQYIN